MQKIQCAVYVRKSTEHGLEQEFNSLDNQELACRSYITSQQFQGWEFYKTYSDGGEVSVHTKTENTQILTKALAFGWKYKKQYEAGVPVEQIRRDEHRADRTVYKYMNLAYLSPRIIGDILEGEVPAHVNLQTLFKIAERYSDFNKQETAFYGA